VNPPRIRNIDHLVIVAENVEETLAFYERVLGAEVRDREAWHEGKVDYPVLHFQSFKFNVHPIRTDASPRAAAPVAGSLDIAFDWAGDVASAEQHLRSNDVAIELGPISQEGARGNGESLYFRDLDGALIEFLCYASSGQPEDL
jgi:catechol 2,3-dioxygenase-like lactoylglutathione lyase family enzyme